MIRLYALILLAFSVLTGAAHAKTLDPEGKIRPELLDRRPGLGGRRASVIRLNSLDDASMSILVDGLVKGLTPEARDMLVARAEGIPLFAVETVRALIDRDAVLPRDGRYVAADGVDASLDSLGAPASRVPPSRPRRHA